jgi:hypothetical protein
MFSYSGGIFRPPLQYPPFYQKPSNQGLGLAFFKAFNAFASAFFVAEVFHDCGKHASFSSRRLFSREQPSSEQQQRISSSLIHRRQEPPAQAGSDT